MTTREKSVIDYVESRIQFYRYCTIVLFVLGLMAGAGVLCGESCLFSIGLPGRHLTFAKCALCFVIALSGIVAASAYRSRIRYAVKRCNKILLCSGGGQAFPKPVPEQSIPEAQVLFGIMFVLAAVVCCVNYPLPDLPGYLDLPLVRLAPLAGFFIFCIISVKLEKKNSLVNLSPIEDFIRLHQKQARIGKYKPAPVPGEWDSENVESDRGPSTNTPAVSGR